MIDQQEKPEALQKQEKIDHLMQELEVAGKRSTPQRYAVCQVLVEHGGHPTVTEVFEQVRQIFPMISQATVYNTIDTLEELGLIQRLDIANHDHTHYDIDVTPHINVVCRYCEYISDVYIAELDNLLNEVSKHMGCDIDRHTGLIVYGVCPTCRAAGKSVPCKKQDETCFSGMGKRRMKHHCQRANGKHCKHKT